MDQRRTFCPNTGKNQLDFRILSEKLTFESKALIRWPTTVTSKPNAHSKLQIAHIKFKSLTANSNRSQQIQITHSKLQIAHSKFKSPTANSNRSQQIKVAHSKFKLLTSNYKLLTPLGVLGYLQPAVQLV